MANKSIYDAFDRFWQHTTLALNNKVDKETNKGLSTNDYGTADKEIVSNANTHIANSDIHVTADDKETWNKSATLINSSSVTNLRGTSWYIKSGWTAPAGYANLNILGTFINGNIAYKIIHLYIGGGFNGEDDHGGLMFSDRENHIIVQDDWARYDELTSSQSFELSFSPEQDLTDASLISWLTTYGTLKVTELPTIEKVNYIHVANSSAEYDATEGIVMSSTYGLSNTTGPVYSSGNKYEVLPIISGSNINFEKDGNFVKVNSSDPIQTCENITDVTDDGHLYRVPESNLYEVVANVTARNAESTYVPTFTSGVNTSEQLDATKFYACFGDSLLSAVTVSSLTQAYRLYYQNLDETLLTAGIRFGSSKNSGSIVFTPAQDGTLQFIKYYTYVANTGTINGYDSGATLIVNGETHTFVDDTTPLDIDVTSGTEYTISTSGGRVILLSFAFGGNAYSYYELARKTNLEDVKSEIVGTSNDKITVKTTLNSLKNIATETDIIAKENKQSIALINSKMGDVQIFDVKTLPAAKQELMPSLFRQDNALHQCVATGDGVSKSFTFAVTAKESSQITNVGGEGGLAWSQLGTNFNHYFSSVGCTKVYGYDGNGPIKLGSSSAVGEITFTRRTEELTQGKDTILPPQEITSVIVGVRAYKTDKKSVFEVSCGTMVKQVVVSDTINDTLIKLEKKELDSYGDIIRIKTLSSAEDSEGNPITLDVRGVVSQLLVNFGEVAYEWKPISGAATESYSEGLAYTLSEDSTYYSVSGIGTCEDTDIIIPSEYKGLPVTSISGIAFADCTSLTSIKIPDSVTSIGSSAFSYCESLTSIEMSNSVTSISHYAFSNCTSLTSIIIPDSVTTIDMEAFAMCMSLTIYCEVDAKPSGWHETWNSTNCPVVWGFANDFIAVNNKIGDISTALDSIITQTNSIIGGNS